jgi:hypothetical protein
MRRFVILAATWLSLTGGLTVAAHEGSTLAAVCDAIRADQPASTATPATPSPVATPTDALPPDAITNAIASLPLFDQPQPVRREANAGQGTVTLSLPEPLDALRVEIAAVAGAAGQIGTVEDAGDYLVFQADFLAYDLAPVALPGGIEVGPQTLDLDPAHADVLCIDTKTGDVFRHFRWILTATDATYDGQPTLPLEDTARIDVLGFTDLGNGEAELRLRTRWQGQLSLDEWTVDDQQLPGGTVNATSVFEDTYIVNISG